MQRYHKNKMATPMYVLHIKHLYLQAIVCFGFYKGLLAKAACRLQVCVCVRV